MGGGDLNSKKSWHPSTIKNQERVWKAEQAAAEEKKRIQELQREKVAERERNELNEMVKRNAGIAVDDSKLNWMYEKPDKSVKEEEYLLGRAIDKNSDSNKVDNDVIPAVARRVVGSSMIATAGDTQVDLVRKLREDPLILVKERERAARAALLNNPLHRRRIAALLKKEQEERREKKACINKKKDNNLDNMLAAKLNALSGEKQIDIATLLASDDSSSDSSEEERPKKKKKKHKKAKKSKKKRSKSIDSESSKSEEERNLKNLKEVHKISLKNSVKSDKKSNKRKDDDIYDSELKRKTKYKAKKLTETDPTSKETKEDKIKRAGRDRTSSPQYERVTRREASPAHKRHADGRVSSPHHHRNRKDEIDRDRHERKHHQTDTRRHYRDEKFNYNVEDRGNNNERRREYKKQGMSESERAAKLAAMAAAGAEREVERGRRVAEQRAPSPPASRASRTALHSEARALPDSLEARIQSNRHYIQRDSRHMNEHFARR